MSEGPPPAAVREPPLAPGAAAAARTAQTAAVLEWMVTVGLIGVGMVVVLVLVMRVFKPRRGKVVRHRTSAASAWQEAGRRMGLDPSGPREDPEADL